MLALQLLLVVIILVLLSGLLVGGLMGGKKSLFFRHIEFIFQLGLIHVVYVLICKSVWPNDPWIENSAPFGLIYGPLFFVGVQRALDVEVSKKTLLLHFLPFILFCFLMIPLFIPNQLLYTPVSFQVILYLLIGVQLTIYCILSLRLLPRLRMNKNLKLGSLLSFVSIIMISLAFQIVIGKFLADEAFEIEANVLNGFKLYILYLMVMVSFLRFMINAQWKYRHSLYLFWNGRKRYLFKSSKQAEVFKRQYSTSSLSGSDFSLIEQQLIQLMEEDEVFLDSELSLTDLAQQLNVPNHYLSQVFSLQLGVNFNTFVNQYRIERVCELMDEKKQEEYTLMDLAYQAGFNSKPTFSRWFKKIKNQTPSTYRTSRT